MDLNQARKLLHPHEGNGFCTDSAPTFANPTTPPNGKSNLEPLLVAPPLQRHLEDSDSQGLLVPIFPGDAVGITPPRSIETSSLEGFILATPSEILAERASKPSPTSPRRLADLDYIQRHCFLPVSQDTDDDVAGPLCPPAKRFRLQPRKSSTVATLFLD